jgi:aminobenzoyl-glutamate utilization protein B
LIILVLRTLPMKPLFIFFALLSSFASIAQTEINPKVKPDKDKQFIATEIDKKSEIYKEVAKDIWSYAELGFLEDKSSKRLEDLLTGEGFKVETGVAGMPTAFVATFGSGEPVIGILAEFDALPGLSQGAVPTKQPVIEGGAGHACGHNLFGAASAAAAIAMKEWLIKNKKSGTIRVFGTPAEEGGGAKTYMVRDGLFNDVGTVLHWHPSNANDASPESCLAIKQTMFRFYGKASHAAAAPQAGRSALDGLEAMNFMVNLMREHVPQETRIHYVISKGGLAANVVPDFAEAEYMVRHPDARMVDEIWNRIVEAAKGAAAGTGTTVKFEVISGSYNLMPNETLSRLMYNNLKLVGGVTYTKEEEAFAKELQGTLSGNVPELVSVQTVEPYHSGGFFPASTDVGDITWVVPTAGLGTATWVPGVSAHSWQAVSTGNNIGLKGMINAAKTIAMTGVDIFNNPDVVVKAKEELRKKVGPDFKFNSMIGDRKPPLDFRKGKQ